MSNDGLVGIVLARPWCDQDTGEMAWVDPERAEWMRANGYEAAVKPAALNDLMNLTRPDKPVDSPADKPADLATVEPKPIDKPTTREEN